MIERFCIQWPKFGPYHNARFREVVENLDGHHVDVTGIQTANRDLTNSWGRQPGNSQNRIHTLFPNSDLSDLEPSQIRRAMLEFLDNFSPQAMAINGYSQPDARASLEWCLDNNASAILMTDSRYTDTSRSMLKELIKKGIVRNFDSAFVAGTESSAYMQRLGIPQERIVAGYDVVDNQHFESPDLPEESVEVQQYSPYLLTVSRFIPRKGIDILLSEYAAYRKAVADPWNLVIVGDDPTKLDKDSRNLVTEGVKFVGVVDYSTLPSFYAHAEALIHSARSDQWGLVVNEAMAAGLPVIVSSGTGSAHDLVYPGENGFIFDAEKSGQLAACLEKISLGQTSLQEMGRRSQEIISDYTPENFATNLFRCISFGRTKRRMATFGKLLLTVGGLLARRPNSFHSIES